MRARGIVNNKFPVRRACDKRNRLRASRNTYHRANQSGASTTRSDDRISRASCNSRDRCNEIARNDHSRTLTEITATLPVLVYVRGSLGPRGSFPGIPRVDSNRSPAIRSDASRLTMGRRTRRHPPHVERTSIDAWGDGEWPRAY